MKRSVYAGLLVLLKSREVEVDMGQIRNNITVVLIKTFGKAASLKTQNRDERNVKADI
jgi:hypothetical protein